MQRDNIKFLSSVNGILGNYTIFDPKLVFSAEFVNNYSSLIDHFYLASHFLDELNENYLIIISKIDYLHVQKSRSTPHSFKLKKQRVSILLNRPIYKPMRRRIESAIKLFDEAKV